MGAVGEQIGEGGLVQVCVGKVAFMLERSNYVKGRARGRLNTSLYGRSRLAKGGG